MFRKSRKTSEHDYERDGPLMARVPITIDSSITPVWREPPPVPQALWDMMEAIIHREQRLGRIGRRAIIPLYVDPWTAAYRHARRIAATRKEWPWPSR